MTLSNYEDELMRAYQNGEEEALEKLYLLFQKPLYAFVFRYSRDEQLSIEIVQDTFVKLQQNKHRFDPSRGRIKSYLFQIAYRLMVNRLNRRKKWRTLLPFLFPAMKEEMPHIERITVREAIAKLPDMQRAVILLYYYHDLSYEEIAEILSVPEGTVKSRLHRAIKNLKKELGGEDIERGSL